MRAVVVIVAALAAALAAPRVAEAFPTGFQFDDDPVTGDGAGGVAFTGAPRFAGHDCAVCHVDPTRQVGVSFDADPVDIFSNGYVPGQQYRMRVRLLREHAAADFLPAGDYCVPNTNQRCDDNGFALEIDDATGHPQGTFVPATANGACTGAPPDASARVLMDGSAVTHSGFHHGLDSWTFCWTAPATGAGPLTAYISAVDGNGGDGTEANPNDVSGDDVVTGAVPLDQAGGEPLGSQRGGCAVAPGRGGPRGLTALIVGALAALLLIVRLVRPRRALALVALGVLLAGSGCAHVKPWEKEKLAERKMQFGADPDEAELDLHMQEAREGSSGGYGSAGGGCGCN